MKLTTKMNRWYFWRELFSYMVPLILIVWIIDVFVSFMRCSTHPEWSAPCSINRIFAIVYGIFLIIIIILAYVSSKMLRKVKKQIENEFTESINNHIQEQIVEDRMNKDKVHEDKVSEKKVKKSQTRKVVAKKDKKSDSKTSENKKISKKVITKKAAKK